jgi:hypothetical protein
MPLKERFVKSLDQIRDNRGKGRPMNKDDLVHHVRAPKPGLVDVRTPLQRRKQDPESA